MQLQSNKQTTVLAVYEDQGPDFQKILGKILSLSKVIKLRFSQNFKFNSLLQY